MKNRFNWRSVLALAGLLALTVYVLACTSFSPDDRKVLYPCFDPNSGALGIAAYDRPSGRSEMLFVPATFGKAGAPEHPEMLRPQWLADGQHLVVAWPGAGSGRGDGLALAVLPWGVQDTVRLFYFPEIESLGALMTPLCVCGDSVLLAQSKTELLKVDLRTGACTVHELAGVEGDLTLYPSGGAWGAFYVEDAKPVVFGWLDAATCARTPLMTITNRLMDGSFFTYDPQGRRVAFVEQTDGPAQVVVLREGAPSFTRTLDVAGAKLAFAGGCFSPDGNTLWASYQQKLPDQEQVAYGLMAIPLNDAPMRQKPLIHSTEASEEGVGISFQLSLSHDGRTAALASTCLAMGKHRLEPENCALFLVDVGDSAWPVTKVPVPVPVAATSR